MKKFPHQSLFPHLLIFLAASLTSSCSSTKEDSNGALEKPNVLLIFTDQQHVDMMSAVGSPYVNTPNMDRIAKRGVLFKQSYCTSPVCGPARSSIISGRMPHETGVEWNGDSMKNNIKNVGQLFRGAGYQTIWGGKWHLPESYPQRPKARQKEIAGFELLPFMAPNPDSWMLGAETDPPLTEAAVKFLSDYKKEQPFFLTVSYHNPHDICFYARKEGWVSEQDSLLNIRHYNFEYQLPDIIGTHPSQYPNLPPLPNNYETEHDEPEFISDKRQYHQEYGLETHLAFNEFSDEEWQGYLNAYHELTEMVDAEIGQVLDALEANGLEENTIIVFTSDHGDGASAHKWAAKLSLYQEPSTVPLIISFPEKISSGRVDQKHLVSQIDIVPTLCDYAGIKTDVTFTGKSLRPILENPDASWRDFLIVELADYKPDQARKGRMVRTANYKYNIYSTGQRNEQLFHLSLDAGETQNLAFMPDYQAIRQDHLGLLKEWMAQTNDNFLLPE